MWKNIRLLLILLSVGLNVAFVAIWAAHALPRHMAGPYAAGHGEGVWCPLHRQLGATQAQWREIEPRLVEFQKSARSICEEVNRARGQMIDLIAAPQPDRESIRGKQEKILECQRRMQELVINHMLNEKEFLTQEQQRELFRMLRQQSGCAGHGPMMGPMGRRAPMCPDGAREEE